MLDNIMLISKDNLREKLTFSYGIFKHPWLLPDFFQILTQITLSKVRFLKSSPNSISRSSLFVESLYNT